MRVRENTEKWDDVANTERAGDDVQWSHMSQSRCCGLKNRNFDKYFLEPLYILVFTEIMGMAGIKLHRQREEVQGGTMKYKTKTKFRPNSRDRNLPPMILSLNNNGKINIIFAVI